MKKTLAILLALALVFSSITVSFAAETLPVDAQACVDLGMIVGDGTGVTQSYLNSVPTRIQAAVMVLNLKGLTDEAKAFTGTDNFADANKAAWAKPIMAYLKAKPELGWIGDGKNFNPTETLTAQMYYKVMLEALGYKAGVDFQWADTFKFAAEKGLKAVAGSTSFAVKDLATATVETLKANVAGGTTTLAAKLVADKVITAEAAAKAGLVDTTALSVASVKANTAKSFVVKFNKAVKDEDKVTVSVVRGTTAVTTTTTWNADKTEATVATASNLAEATFTIVVKADAKELAKQDVTITAQKVAKIEYTSKAVAVNLSNGKGFVTYKVYDQYNNDITTNYLANNLTWNTGVGSISAKNGLAEILPGSTPLLQFQTLTVIAYDTTSGISATVSLPTSTAMGTLSDFTLGSVENVKLVDGDVTSVYYIPYVAKDMSGNETKDFNLVKGGLILQGAGTDELVVSLNGNVEAKVVQDPADSRLAAIQVRAKSTGSQLVMDMPVTITAMTYTGKSSQVQTTMAKAKKIHSITLLAPSATVAIGERPEIGFEAYDQHGNRITKYSEIKTFVSEVGFDITQKVDGTAKFKLTAAATANKGVTTLTSVVNATGKMSTININVQDVAKPSRLAIDTTPIVTAMEHGATQKVGLVDGEDGEIKIYDQYDREMDKDDINNAFTTGILVQTPTGPVTKTYAVVATSTSAQVTLGGTLATASSDVTVTANASSGGAGTIQFTLVDTAAPTVALSTVSTSIAVIQTTDIIDYTINPISAAIYTSNQAGDTTTWTDREKAYAANPKVYGKTNSGAKVLLAGSPIVGTSVDNTDFYVTVATGNFKAVKVMANKFTDPAKTGSTTKVTLSLLHNGKLTAVSTDIKSTTVAPYSVDIITEGDSLSDDVVTGVAATALNGRYVVGYTPAPGDAATVAADPTATPAVVGNNTGLHFIFKNKDQYGKYAQPFANFYISQQTGTFGSLSINADGQLTVTTPSAGASFVITGVTTNGLVKNVKVQF